MSIHALPQSTVRTIRSGQALTDPISVVKELIDNALDARATNITVEISANTLDIIQVKDNGHGIAPTDRPLVAKPYCTSKLQDEKDLASVGGSYLGFRGEALSSALEMSGEMVITTRVEGESVACALKIPPNGEATQDRATHPPGTTVRISNFLKNQPVRKQTALKNATKVLAKIKSLLQSYAFARPATRLSLRVIKAKNDKENWTYSPKTGAGIEDTALKVVAKPCASQCHWAEVELDGFVVQAYLPRTDAHAPKISGMGQYVSVNGRPLASNRGVSRQFIKIYKEGLRNVPTLEDAKDPFLYLSVLCPSGTYDANIEPAKDDVLFGDVDKVNNAVRRLMTIAYPEKGDIVEQPDVQDSEENAFVALRPPDSHVKIVDIPCITPGPRSPRVDTDAKDNMYDVDEDDLTLFMDSVDQPEELQEEEEDVKSAKVSNPWIMAKMNSYGNKTKNTNVQLMTPARQTTNSVSRSSSPVRKTQPAAQLPMGLPTPRASSPLLHAEDESLLRRVIGPSTLPPAISHLPRESVSPTRFSSEMPEQTPVPNRLSLPFHQDTEGTSLDQIPDRTPRSRSPPKKAREQYANKPFVSPVNPERDAWFHFPESETRSRRFPRKGQSQGQAGQDLVPSGEPYSNLTPPSNNADIREFLGRRGNRAEQQSSTPGIQDSTPDGVDADIENTLPIEQPGPQSRGTKDFVMASELDLESSQFLTQQKPPLPPPRRKTNVSRRVLSERSENARAPVADDSASEYEENNPPKRKRTTDTAAERKRSKRIKSSTLLRMETVPVAAQTQHIIARVPTTIEAISRNLSQNVVSSDSFVGFNAPALLSQLDEDRDFAGIDIGKWTTVLERLLQQREPDSEVIRDLRDVVKSAVDRWGDSSSV